MIYLEGLESIIECLYLEESISNKSSNCNIFVNPENIKYLMGKTVIINSYDYPEDNLYILLSNGCQVISRIYTAVPNILVQPYILRVNDKVRWNGRVINSFSDFSELVENDLCTFDPDNYVLYFPKILSEDQEEIRSTDDYGNLTGLGWALQQVGINVKKDTAFVNIDVIKTGKLYL